MSYKSDYIEFWATGHCNLNCKGCSSCSPIVQEWFLDVESIERDLFRLNELDIEIGNITILGGEPLLHPNLLSIMEVVKKVYPKSRLGMITNGLLLLQMPELFWNACVKYDVKFSVTCFPIMSEDVKLNIEKIFCSKKLEYRFTNKKWFNKILTRNNQEDLVSIISSCGCNKAYNLKGGEVSRCTVPMAVPLLNKCFNAGMIEGGRLDIYSVQSGTEIIDFLDTPNESCRNCSAHPIKVEWKKSDNSPKLSDWII